MLKNRSKSSAGFILGLSSLPLAIGAIAVGSVSKVGAKGGDWPGNEIRMYDRSGWGSSVPWAVERWNATGIGIKLRLVPDPGQAQVEIVSTKHFRDGCNGKSVVGCAGIGYQPWHQPQKIELSPPGKENDDMEMRIVAMHEIGHLLGLDHDGPQKSDRFHPKCQLMNSYVCVDSKSVLVPSLPGCPVRPGDSFQPTDLCPGTLHYSSLCGPSRSEVKQLIDRYGGQIPKGYSEWCESVDQQPWLGGCAYPQWQPRVQDYLPMDPATGKTCAPEAPRWAWQVLGDSLRIAHENYSTDPTHHNFAQIRRWQRLAVNCPRPLCDDPEWKDPGYLPSAPAEVRKRLGVPTD